MTMTVSRLASGLAIATLATLPPLTAQEAAAAPATSPQSPTEILADALQRSTGQPSLEFQTLEVQDSAITRRFAAMMGGTDQEVNGECTPELAVFAPVDADGHVVRYRGRTVATDGTGPWRLVRDRDAHGDKLPFVVDPFQLFDLLRECDIRVERTESLDMRGEAMDAYSFTLTGRDAKRLANSGLLPEVASVGSVIRIGGMGRGNMPQPDVTIDGVVYVHPEEGTVRRVRFKAYTSGGMMGQVQIQGAGGAGGVFGDAQDEPEEVEEFGADGQRIHERGLPVRAVDGQTSVMEFDLQIQSYGMPVQPRLDADARRLLRMGL